MNTPPPSTSMRTRLVRRARRNARVPERFVLLAALALGILSSAGHALAQTDAAATASATPVAAPASAIPLSEIPSRADELGDELRELQRDVDSGEIEQQIAGELPELAEAVEPRAAEAQSVLVGSPSLSDLDELSRVWKANERMLQSRERKLRRRVSELEAEIASFRGLIELWERTRLEALVANAPPALLQDIDQTLARLRELDEALASSRNEALVLQSQVSELLRLASRTVEGIEATRDRVVENILVRDRQPIWRTERSSAAAPKPKPAADASKPAAEEETGFRAGLQRWLAQVRDALTDYWRLSAERVALHLIAFVGFAFLLFRARSAFARSADEAAGQEGGEALEAARHAFDRPISGALVLSLVTNPWIHPEAPLALHDLAGIVLLVPLLRVLRSLLRPSLYPVVTALAAFYLTDQLRDILADSELVVRWIFLLEMIAAALGLAWLMRSARLGQLPPAAGRLWLRALGVWIRAALAAVALAALGSALGYTSAATLLGNATLGSGYLGLGLYAGVGIAHGLVVAFTRSGGIRELSQTIRDHGDFIIHHADWILRVAAVVLWGYSVLGLLALRQRAGAALDAVLSFRIGYGTFALALGDLFAFFLTLWVAWAVSRLLRTVLEKEIYPRVELPRGVPFALSTMGGYAILVLGFVVALGALGFDLDRVTILVGAFGVGIGFGLQTIVNNFVSGLILLFERPIQVGDRVQLAELNGVVTRIGIRASTLRTWEGADVIVPNSSLISDRLINWTLADRLRRIDLPIGVAYGSDPARVIEVLHERIAPHAEVLSHPRLEVFFTGFGDSSLDFEIRAWTDNAEDWVRIKSELGVMTNAALAEAGIEIPFPQRDVHLRSAPEP